MLRAAASSVTRRVVTQSARGIPACAAPRVNHFHASSKNKEEEKALEAPAPSKGGLFGTGLSEWFALPIGLTAAIPVIQFEWYVVDYETQLVAVFLAFCVTAYTQGGDAIYKALDDQAQTLLKEHNEAEDKMIDALEQKLEFLKANQNMVNDFEAINKLRAEGYANLNAAGAIKPQHDLKAQVERVLNMIAQEETTVADKAKMALMQQATATVMEQFSTQKNLQKAALDAAIGKIKGAKATSDPVQEAFVKFFQKTAADAKKKDDGSEEAAQRAALVQKLNAVAKSEGFFFEFDAATGQPKMMA